MNFKDRLELVNTSNNYFIKKDDYIEVKTEEDVKNLFVKNEILENSVSNILKTNKNVILASNINCDKNIIVQYIKTLMPKNLTFEFINDLEKELPLDKNRLIVESEVSEYKKIFEYILQGYSGFVFNVNVKTFVDFVEILKILIMMNYPNLTEKQVNTLVGLSDCIVIYIDKNTSGQYFVSQSAELRYVNSQIELLPLAENSVVSDIDNEIVEEIEDDKILEEIKEEDKVSEEMKEEPVFIEEVEVEAEVVEVPEEETTSQKVNKYKLLKQKIKNKKENHTDI